MTLQLPPWLQELEGLLAEQQDTAAKRASSTLDHLGKATSSRMVLFGCGGLGRKTLTGLRRLGIEPEAFADNNSDLWGRTIDGIPVLSPENAAKQFAKNCLFVVTIWRAQGTHRFMETREQLRSLGCNSIAHFGHLAWKYPETFLPYYCMDLPQKVLEQRHEILRLAPLWADEYSQRQYVAQIKWRLHLNFDAFTSPVAEEQYFPKDLISLNSSESMVDCGAFDGDTLKRFIALRENKFKEYVALEPDPLNFNKMQQFVSTLESSVQQRIHLHQLAVGASQGSILFASSGLASAAASTQGDVQVECVPLDELLTKSSKDFIKMDIEGAELQALEGARETIRRTVPTLAICVYHQQNHLWKIPSLILSLSDRYRIFLRPHNEEGWDLVLYALPTA